MVGRVVVGRVLEVGRVVVGLVLELLGRVDVGRVLDVGLVVVGLVLEVFPLLVRVDLLLERLIELEREYPLPLFKVLLFLPLLEYLEAYALWLFLPLLYA